MNLNFFPKKSKAKEITEINALEIEMQALTEEGLQEASKLLQQKARNGEPLNELLPRAFALVRETARHTLHQRHFDAQIMGGLVLHQGKIAEMRTGEGKTLAATLPAYLNALSGKGVHVVTVNEYLAKRDTVWMGQIYDMLGLTTACLVHNSAFMYDPQYKREHLHKTNHERDEERDTLGSFRVEESYLRPISRREAYEADITYGTNHEFGFDYLRDNLAHDKENQVQSRGGQVNAHNYAIIDEVDSILIDEARTPLIISAPDAASSEFYQTFARVVARLEKEKDYSVDEKLRSVDITNEGITAVEKALNVSNLYAPEHLRLTHYLQESLRAKELFLKDRDYVTKDGKIIIVDQFTGRLMQGRRYSGGLHQAIEAKEGVHVEQESRTYASISIQNYFRMYNKLSGMTGTAETSAEEFDKVYNLEVETIPTNKPMIRKDDSDLIYKTKEAKYNAIIEDIKKRQEKRQPVLVGTVSIEKNEELSHHLTQSGIKHEVLNAKNNEREGAIIAQAGKPGAVTIATNMAGRGVDIILGGNPPEEEDADIVRANGGLHVIGTERHESRRIDNQLRGRAGRQGDPGSSQFFLSLEDDLMRIFGGDRIHGLMETLKMPDNMPIQTKMINRAIGQAQTKVEGRNFDARKHLLDFDDVLNKQRKAIYTKRQNILSQKKVTVITSSTRPESGENVLNETEQREEIVQLSEQMLPLVLGAFDMVWMHHLENMEALQESVRLRAYGQHDPLVEYRRESKMLFEQVRYDFNQWMQENKSRLEELVEHRNEHIHKHHVLKRQTINTHKKIGRNDPCPCGSGKKYKRCHGE
jgi:preprotein translocase subunit SecA